MKIEQVLDVPDQVDQLSNESDAESIRSIFSWHCLSEKAYYSEAAAKMLIGRPDDF